MLGAAYLLLLTTLMTTRLAGRHLYIADLARRQAAFEDGYEPMSPVGYRVLARRLRSALAGQAPTRVRHDFRELPPRLLLVLTEAHQARHFDEHGVLDGPAAAGAKAHTQALLGRLRCPGDPRA